MPVNRPRFRMPIFAAAVAVVALSASGSASAAPGPISTFAGGGTSLDEGVAATSAFLRRPRRVAFPPGGGVLVVEFASQDPDAPVTEPGGRVRRIQGGTITTVAGSGVLGFSGDGGPATAADMYGPSDIAVTQDGGFLIADEFNHRVRKVSAGGTISTVVGTGSDSCRRYVPSGDPGFRIGDTPGPVPATSAALSWVRGLAMYPDGSYLVIDENCGLVHRVASGMLQTVAGTVGPAGFGGDGGPALSARFNQPRGVAVAKDGGFYIADSRNERVRRVWPDGKITTFAGTGSQGYDGNGRPATSARLNTPRDVDEAPDGSLVIADSGNNRVRLVAPDGTITLLAGTGSFSASGDGGPATSAGISQPHGVNIAANGDLYISGSGLTGDIVTFAAAGNFRVRRVPTAVSATSAAALPAPPRITGGPVEGATTTDRTPAFTLTGMADSTFVWRVRDAGTGDLLAGAAGEEDDGTLTLPALADGNWFLEVRQRTAPTASPANTPGVWTTARFTVAASAPPAPQLTVVPGPSTETRPTFAWTGDGAIGPAAFTWQVLSAGGQAVQGPSDTATPTVRLPQALAPGTYTFQVRQRDELGTPGAWASAPFTVNAPPVPGPGPGPGPGGGGGTGGGVTPTPPETPPATRNAARLVPRAGVTVPRAATALRWVATRGAAGYRIRVYRLAGTRRILVATLDTRGRTVTVPRAKLAPGTRYVWTVSVRRRADGRLVTARTPVAVSWFRTTTAG